MLSLHCQTLQLRSTRDGSRSVMLPAGLPSILLRRVSQEYAVAVPVNVKKSSRDSCGVGSLFVTAEV
ncbi:hypothetical protein E2C01_063338 [Portunus trituberculatus]|uniref:Uncharacterized protein n=1 Tax=Portunus trituberculatus TaxID=210409 RepID=A0A5B7HG29_PORTR|nr:hypothetical protein [Portunus trituberculatus]